MLFGDDTQTHGHPYRDDIGGGLRAVMATGDKMTGPINPGNPVEIPVSGVQPPVAM